MNSNRGNNNNSNNRRRGRGSNNRPQGGGSGQQLNRIDSRARGNAPQMLEKYRKLAHDAHLNGDRVQEESFLQYADHYFRVIADQRARQDEQRTPRSNERWQEGSEGEREDSVDGGEFGTESEYQSYDRQNYSQNYNRSEREERPQDRPREDRPRDNRQRDNRPNDERPIEDRAGSPAEASEDNRSADDSAAAFEPAENPFVREARAPRGLRPRREDRGPRVARPAQDDSDGFDSRSGDDGAGLDPAILPPPISIQREDPADEAAIPADEAEAAAPRRRTRRPRPPQDDAGEVVEVAN